ncbi:hypothetical protein FHG87_006214 [Trinorchestia longiramus]|nr:hypothetical protein FHG87_006214 [Trinorchestia longiramus]
MLLIVAKSFELESGLLDLSITAEDVRSVVNDAVATLKYLVEQREPEIFSSGGKLGPDSPSYHYYSLLLGTEMTRQISAAASISVISTHLLAVRHNLTVGQVSLMLPQINTENTVLGSECPTPLPPTSCSPSRFRTLDGTCNNPDQPRWGAANTPFLRLLPAWYRDGVTEPRGSLSGDDLPSAARISRVAHSGSAVSHAHTSLLVPMWAHYLSQDLSRPIVSLGVRGERVRTVNSNNSWYGV